jgi:porin
LIRTLIHKKIAIFSTFIIFALSGQAIADASNIESISANPAATNVVTGSGALQKAIEKNLNITNDHGIKIGGAWTADMNKLFSGGAPDADRFTTNNLFQLGLTADTAKMIGWQGGLFDIEFLQFNGEKTNEAAGTAQGYNSLPGAFPLDRSELYQLWYRQKLFNDQFIFRIGKQVPTFDFNNVVKPVPLNELDIPAVSSLIYTPLFVNTSMLGVLPGYYNSAYGITLYFVPSKKWYATVGAYDGNEAAGVQTGTKIGPTWNGSYFYIGETGLAWLLGTENKPGNIGLGVWHHTGLIEESSLSEEGASGIYLHGSQRLWYKDPGINYSGISGFYQYGINNSDVLSMTQYLGAGLTAFGLIPSRLSDSFGAGLALSWLNQASFLQRTELMFQAYYQAKIISGVYLEPALSYIPDPAVGDNLPAAFAGTLRAIILF